MVSGFVVGYCIVLANLFYLNNNPLSRLYDLEIKTFFGFWISLLVDSRNAVKFSFHPVFYAVKRLFEVGFMQLQGKLKSFCKSVN